MLPWYFTGVNTVIGIVCFRHNIYHVDVMIRLKQKPPLDLGNTTASPQGQSASGGSNPVKSSEGKKKIRFGSRFAGRKPSSISHDRIVEQAKAIVSGDVPERHDLVAPTPSAPVRPDVPVLPDAGMPEFDFSGSGITPENRGRMQAHGIVPVAKKIEAPEIEAPVDDVGIHAETPEPQVIESVERPVVEKPKKIVLKSRVRVMKSGNETSGNDRVTEVAKAVSSRTRVSMLDRRRRHADVQEQPDTRPSVPEASPERSSSASVSGVGFAREFNGVPLPDSPPPQSGGSYNDICEWLLSAIPEEAQDFGYLDIPAVESLAIDLWFGKHREEIVQPRINHALKMSEKEVRKSSPSFSM